MSLFIPIENLENRFTAPVAEEWMPWDNIAPRDDLAVIPNHSSEPIEQYEWGLIPSWVDDRRLPRPTPERGITKHCIGTDTVLDHDTGIQ